MQYQYPVIRKTDTSICLQPPENLCTVVSYWAEQISFPVLYENQNKKESALNIRMVLDSYRYMEAGTAHSRL